MGVPHQSAPSRSRLLHGFLPLSMAQYPNMSETGWRLVSTIAIDEVWSALPSGG
jgi:hypothetical protein